MKNEFRIGIYTKDASQASKRHELQAGGGFAGDWRG